MTVQRLNEHQSGLAAILLAAFLWSTGGLFIKLIHIDAQAILSLRALFAALLFGIL